MTRRMAQVIFGGPDEARALVCSARRQQGLHQLYHDGCREGTCQRCVLYLAHNAGADLPLA